MNKHIIWDLDGTLIDSEREILSTVNKALNDVGLSVNDALKPIKIGPPLDKMLEDAFSPDLLTNDKKELVIKAYRKIYDNSDYEDTIPFDGIEMILNKKKYIHHIVTNKPELATKRIVNKKNWDLFFETIQSSSSIDNTKSTKRELFQKLKK